MVTFLLAYRPKLAPVLLGLLFIFGFEAAAYAASVSDVIEMLKYTYMGDRVAYLASLEVVAWNMLKKKQLPMGGRGQMLLPIRTKNAGIWRGITEAGVLPTDRAQPDTQEASYSLQEFYGAINVSWRLIQDASKDRYAFERAIDFVDNAFRARLFRLINMDLLGTGKGELGILPAADNQTTVTVASMPGPDVGMLVDLMDADDDNTTLGVANEAVTATDVINNTISQTSAAAGTAASDYYTVASSVRTATGALHMLGLLAWISDANPSTVVGNPGGINRSTVGNDFWKASVLSNSGVNRPLTEDLLLQAGDSVRKRGGKPINKWMSNLNLVRRYHELLKEDTFFAYGSGPKELGSGVGVGRDEKGMKQGENSDGESIYRFSGTQWHVDPFFHANKLIGLNTEHFWIGHGENEVPQVLSEVFDGQVPYLTKTANAYFDIEYYWQGELICDAPNASVLIKDLAES